MATRKINAAILWSNNKGYFFEGNKYYRYEPGKKVDKGYPKPIAGNWKKWPNNFNNGIDAAIFWQPNNKGYFFKGEWYIRYTPGVGCDRGYPKKIKGNWKKWPEYFTTGIDASVFVKDNNKGYFFKGDKYIRYTPGAGCDSGYPKKIKDNWKGWPMSFNSGIDSAILWTNNKLYFFKDDTYIRHTFGQGCDNGYPKIVGGNNWDGLFKRYSSKTVIDILKNSLQGKLKIGNKIHLGDGGYYFLERNDADTVLANSSVDAYNYTWEKFDCDDFAWILKGDFVKDGYSDMERRFPHCVGVVWGDLPSPHAINWMINDDQELRFIEPQNDAIFKPRSNDKNIYMLIS